MRPSTVSAMGRTAIRLAWYKVSYYFKKPKCDLTYVFDIWTRVDGDDIAMFDSKIVTDNAVHPCTAVIKIILSQNDQDGILPLLALNKDCVTTEKPQSLHGIIGKADDRIVIVDGISNAIARYQRRSQTWSMEQ